MQRFACAPYVAPNDAEWAMCSETTSELTLSSSTPPYASGTLTPSKPEVAAPLQQRTGERPVLGLEPLECRQHFLFARTRLPCRAISRCSSVIRSGVKTSDAGALWRSHAPPLTSLLPSP